MNRIVGALALVSLVACADRAASPSCAADLAAGDLLVTEIFADHAAPPGASATDAGHEWIEITNASAAPIDLAGVAITASRPDGSSAKTHVMREAIVAPGAYFVLGDVDPAAAPSWPPWIDYGYGGALGELFNTHGGAIAIACNGVELERAVYGDATPGFSAQRSASGWCTADAAHAVEFEPGNYGTPGDPNPPCASDAPGTCDDGGARRAIVSPAAGQLAITEWMPDPAAVADNAGEWLEVQATADVDLNAVALGATIDDARPVIAGDACAHVAAGGFAIFAHGADAGANGGLPRVDGALGFALVNANGTAELGVGGVVLDRVTWASASRGRSIQRDGAVGGQCAAPDGTPAYNGTDVGTPGAAAAIPCP